MGRPQFAVAGTQGSGRVVASTDRPEIQALDETQTGSVAAGNTETVTIAPPSGSIYRVMALWLECQPDGDATSGDHAFIVTSADLVQTLQGKSNRNTKVLFQEGYWKAGDVVKSPSQEAAAVQVMQQLTATASAPLKVEYFNQTDAAQENNRVIQLVVREDSL